MKNKTLLTIITALIFVFYAVGLPFTPRANIDMDGVYNITDLNCIDWNMGNLQCGYIAGVSNCSAAGSCSNILYSNQEAGLNVNSSAYVNSSGVLNEYWVNAAGDSMTGDLNLGNNSINNVYQVNGADVLNWSKTIAGTNVTITYYH